MIRQKGSLAGDEEKAELRRFSLCKKSKKKTCEKLAEKPLAVCCGLRGRAGAEKLCKYLYKFGDMHYALADPFCPTPLVSVFIDYLFIFYIVLSLSLSVPIPHTVALLFYFIIHVAKKMHFMQQNAYKGPRPSYAHASTRYGLIFYASVCVLFVCVHFDLSANK